MYNILQARKKHRMFSFTYSTTCTRQENNWSSQLIKRLSSCRDSSSVYCPVSNGDLLPTSRHRDLKPASRSLRKKYTLTDWIFRKRSSNILHTASPRMYVSWKAH